MLRYNFKKSSNISFYRLFCNYIPKRLLKWEELYNIKQEKIKKQEKKEIKINIFDQEIKGISNETSILSLFSTNKKLQSLKKKIIAAEVNGNIIDLSNILTNDTSVTRLISFDSKEGKQIFWHSSAHVLGYALEQYHGSDYNKTNPWKSLNNPKRLSNGNIYLDDGPALDNGGFFYDFAFKLYNSNEYSSINNYNEDLKSLIKWMSFLINQGESFQRLELSKDEALYLFNYNPLKLNIINQLSDNDIISTYRIGDFIDLCKGPHLPNSSFIKKFDITSKLSITSQSLSSIPIIRLCGISFPSNIAQKEWETLQEERKLYNHRNIGKTQELFMSHPFSPGSPFYLPHGVSIYNKLQQYLQQEYKKRNYQEVITPNIFIKDLWETSGHWDNYKENMFIVKSNHASSNNTHIEHNDNNNNDNNDNNNNDLCLKPMNCPAHCLIFSHKTRSYKELPLRLAEFGVLHRDELTGTLTGLTRVRRFLQDDAHIFCTEDQISNEVKECITFIQSVYAMFNFKYSIYLSTRPTKAIGDIEQWNRAENALIEQLTLLKIPFKINKGDGAFYGPKIDVIITDSQEKEHQCATIQLDFQLPQRFNLKYIGDDNTSHTPIMIHRAILGSFERFIAILAEHTKGKWPLWINPRQCLVCSVNDSHIHYADNITNKLKQYNILVETNYSSDTLSKKIKEATKLHFSYIIVIGDKEKEQNTIAYRERGSYKLNTISTDKFIDLINKQIELFQ